MRRFSILSILLLLSSIAAQSEAAEQTAVTPGFSSCSSSYSGGIYRIDLVSGNRTIISGRDDDCTLVGDGPEFFGNNWFGQIDVADDGRIVAGFAHNPPSGTERPTIWLVDPVSGDRIIVSGCADPSCSSTVGSGTLFTFFRGLALEPPPPPPAVGALPSWGLALLVGVLIGVTLRTSRSQKQLTA